METNEKKFYEESSFWAGVGAYYGLSWIFTFFPAFVLGLFICQQSEPTDDGMPELYGLIFMIIGYIFIQGLIFFEKYTAVVIVYLLTLWPFLKILKHCWDFAGDNDTFPLPAVDWIPFF